MIQITAGIIKYCFAAISLELPVSVKTQDPAAEKNSLKKTINMFWESAFSITSSKERKQQHLKLIVFDCIPEIILQSSFLCRNHYFVFIYVFICCCLFRKKPFRVKWATANRTLCHWLGFVLVSKTALCSLTINEWNNILIVWCSLKLLLLF